MRNAVSVESNRNAILLEVPPEILSAVKQVEQLLVKSYEHDGPLLLELIPVSVAWSD